MRLPEALQHFEAVDPGQVEVQQNELEVDIAGGKIQRRCAVVGLHDANGRIELLEDLPQRLADQRMVVDHKYFQLLSRRWIAAAWRAAVVVIGASVNKKHTLGSFAGLGIRPV